MADIPLKAEDESHAGCYVGPLLRAAEQWPVLPDLVLTLPTYLRAWVQKLAHGGYSRPGLDFEHFSWIFSDTMPLPHTPCVVLFL